jgi:hypothetical protein
VLLEQVLLHQVLQAVAVTVEFEQIKKYSERQVGNHQLTLRIDAVDEIFVEGTNLLQFLVAQGLALGVEERDGGLGDS